MVEELTISIIFFYELNDFLKPYLRNGVEKYRIKGTPSIKHIFEALGVPHPEVGEIYVNNNSVDFSYLVSKGDEIEVYPISGTTQLFRQSLKRNSSDRQPAFILDNHLGKLAEYLRMIGFDTLYKNNFQDNELAKIASEDNRLLLTRDRGLLMRNSISLGYCIRNLKPKEQLIEVVERFELFDKILPFHRCLICNKPLVPVSKESILHRLKPLTRLYYDEFHVCPKCERIYWKGSHFYRMNQLIEEIIQKRKVYQ